MSNAPASFNISHRGHERVCTVAGPSRNAIVGDGGERRKNTTVRLGTETVTVGINLYRRNHVQKVAASSFGPSLVIEANGLIQQVDCGGHTLQDVEWLARQISYVVSPAANSLKATMDGVTLEMRTPDPATAQFRSNAALGTLGIAAAGLALVALQHVVADPNLGASATVIGASLVAAGAGLDARYWHVLRGMFLQTVDCTVAAEATGFSIHRHTYIPSPTQVIPWGSVHGVTEDFHSLAFTLQTGEGSVVLRPSPEQSKQDIARMIQRIRTLIDDFHGGSAHDNERAVRKEAGRIKGAVQQRD